MTKAEAAELAGQLPTMPGLLRVDRATIAVEAKLDGKFLLRSSAPSSPPRTSPWATSSCSKSSAAGGT